MSLEETVIFFPLDNRCCDWHWSYNPFCCLAEQTALCHYKGITLQSPKYPLTDCTSGSESGCELEAHLADKVDLFLC